MIGVFSCKQKVENGGNEVLVFCASSLTNVMSEMVEVFEAENKIDIQLNFASSGALARQIGHGANAAIYISANEKWIDYLIDLEFTTPETKCIVAENSLVIIVPADSSVDNVKIDDGFPNRFKGRLAIGDPKHVPAGEYAKQVLVNSHLWASLHNRIVPTKDVRSALMLVEMGEVDMGIVYKTDALKSEKVRVVSDISRHLYEPIHFYASILNKKNCKQSQLFYTFLNSNKVKAIWQKHGFTID